MSVLAGLGQRVPDSNIVPFDVRVGFHHRVKRWILPPQATCDAFTEN